MEEFGKYLQKGDRDRCVMLALRALKDGVVDIQGLYEKVLVPFLNKGESSLDSPASIWSEMSRVNILKAVVESCYPYVLMERRKKGRDKIGQRIMVYCPREKHHEVHARMLADFFTLQGLDSFLLGNGDPMELIMYGVEVYAPVFIVISISDVYGVNAAKSFLDHLVNSENLLRINYGIVLTGSGVAKDLELLEKLGADGYIGNYEDVSALTQLD